MFVNKWWNDKVSISISQDKIDNSIKLFYDEDTTEEGDIDENSTDN